MILKFFGQFRRVLKGFAICVLCGIYYNANAQETKILLESNDLKSLQITEAEVLSLVQQQIQDTDILGADRSVVELSAQGTAMMALESNIILRRGILNNKVVNALLQEARAVFDPKFVLSLDYERSQNNERRENVKQFVSQTTVNEEGENVLLIEETSDPRVPEVVYTNARGEGFIDQEVIASSESITGATEQLTMGAAIDQQLPWGGSLNLAYKAINRETFFINNPQLLSSGSDVSKDLVGFGSYNRPWVSELALSLEMPMPGARGFGSYSINDLQRARALSSKEQSDHNLRSEVSNTLLSADLAYWDLAESALALLTIQESMKAANALNNSTTRLFNARSANNYDQAQADLNLANAKAQADSLWSQYLSASDRLALLLDLNSASVIVPQGYTDLLGGISTSIQDDTIDLTQHSQYLSQQSETAILQLDRNAGRQALMPDVQLGAGMTLRQSNQVFGYSDFAESLAAVFNPDIVTKNIGVAYSLPLGNRGLKAQSRASEARLRQSNDILVAKKHTLDSSLINAETELFGAISTVDFSLNAVKLSEQSYVKALEKQKSRQVKEFELAGLHAALVNTRLEHTRALINVQRAQTRLLAARDQLPEAQAGRLANNDFERWRLAMLQKLGESQMFLPQGGVQ